MGRCEQKKLEGEKEEKKTIEKRTRNGLISGIEKGKKASKFKMRDCAAVKEQAMQRQVFKEDSAAKAHR